MSDGLPLRVTRRAAREIFEASAWWDANRPVASDTFRREIENAFKLVAAHPSIGARALNSRLAGVRRITLSRLRYHLYYRVTYQPETVEVLALWHASRGAEPGV